MKFSIYQLTLLLLFPLFAFNSFAQERYRIIYDYQTDKLGVFHLNKKNQVDDTLRKAVLRRNSLVEIQVRNLNPFAVELQPEVTKENFDPTDMGFNPSSLISGISSFNRGSMSMNIDNLPPDRIFSSTIGDEVGAEETDPSKSRGAKQADLQERFDHLKTLYFGIEEIKSKLIGNLINPNLSKEQIQNNAIVPSIIYNDDRLANTKQNFYAYLAKLEEILVQDSENIIGILNQEKKNLNSQLDNINVSRGQKESAQFSQEQIERLVKDLDQIGISKIENLQTIKSLYGALEASNFDQTMDYIVESDRVNINLRFKQSVFARDLNEEGTQETLKSRMIKVFAKGGIKINTSVAITLNNYGESSKDYYTINEGDVTGSPIVGADDNDYYIPNLSTMINFYPVLSESFNLGGTFGVSIPISTGDDTPNGINFLLGPSLFFGSESRVSLSAGLAYGPVRRLKNGLEIGDPTDLGESDLTKTVYDAGFFFGVSFSLFELNRN